MKRRAIVLAAALLALGSLSVPAIAIAPEAVPADTTAPDDGASAIDRLAGADRYETAALTALQAYPDGSDTVLVATGQNFPDALAASYLAGNPEVDAPILLTEHDDLPQFTIDAITELGATNVIVLGRTDAVSAEVVAELEALVGADNVDVIGGPTRIETAAMIARAGGEVGTTRNLSDDTDDTELKTAIIARSDAFPDALAAGPLALEGRFPILLSDTNEIPQATLDALTDAGLGIQQVIITGGPVAISEEVEQQIADLDNIVSVHRVEGENRTATAVELATLTRDLLGWTATNISLARGDNFPDALTLAPLASDLDASLYLSRTPETIEGDTFEGIQDLCAANENLLITGGPVAISADAEGEAKLATICANHSFPIRGAQEAPADGKQGAEGVGWLFLTDSTVCVAYDVEGLEGVANASHIHEAVQGTAGSIVLDLGAPNINGYLATCAENAALAQAIAAEPFAYYVNIHTPDFPDGAARGQIAGNADMTVPLEGETEVTTDADGNFTGFVDTPAAGEGQVDLFFRKGEVCYNLRVSGLESPVNTAIAGGFHIHEGAFNANGGIVLPLPQAAPATAYTAFDCVEAPQDLIDSILADPAGFYLNLHTIDAPGGALRGQLGSTAELRIFGDAEVDDSTPSDPVFGQGQDGLVGLANLYQVDATTVCIDLELPDGTEALTAAHIHPGRVDVNGPPQIPFDGLAGTTPADHQVTCQSGLAAGTAETVFAAPADHYLNVHTASFPAGAARGQLGTFAEFDTELRGDNEVDDDPDTAIAGDPTGLGEARVYPASLTNQDVVCTSFHVKGLDPLTAAHIHNAPAGTNGDVVVTIGDYGDAGTAAPGADLPAVPGVQAPADADFGCQTDVDPTVAQAVFTTPEEHYVNVHSETFPAGAVRGQLGEPAT